MLFHDFQTNTGKSIHKASFYLPIYEKHLEKFKNQSVIMWEIGVDNGGSLQMWKRYLGPFATIIGIDIRDICKQHEDNQIHVRIGDQSDIAFLQSIIDEFGLPDIIIDDGSHIMKHICATFDFMYDKLSKNGIYLVEDLSTAYNSDFGGGLNRSDTFIEKCKEFIDLINAHNNNLPCDFADSTLSMTFYDSIVVFEKIQWSKASRVTARIPDLINKNLIKEHYPEYKLSNLKNVFLFGAGIIGKSFISKFNALGINILNFIDNDISKHHVFYNGIEIISVDESLTHDNTTYIITVNSEDIAYEIFEQLKSLGVSNDILFYKNNSLFKLSCKY